MRPALAACLLLGALDLCAAASAARLRSNPPATGAAAPAKAPAQALRPAK